MRSSIDTLKEGVHRYIDPSSYLNIEMDEYQPGRLFCPSPLNIMIDYIIRNVSWSGAKKQYSKRRLNLIHSTISSHCSVLNTD